ncbi:MAG: hypothetical protein NT135_01655 [Candidatus Berkelbacteria bacterium]|nr:hypothetical protein [Candidatus Berkelbacteria bacterium]
MSLGINATTAEGMVLAADSRQSYRNQKGMARIGSDSASKVFKLSSKIGLIVAGLAFLPENTMPKNISNFIEDFKSGQDLEQLTLKEISKKLRAFFEKKYPYQQQLDLLPQQIEIDLKSKGCEILEVNKKKFHVEFRFRDPAGVTRQGVGGIDQLQFALAGYDEDGSHAVYTISVPGDNPQENRSSKVKGKEFGASWIGQIDVVSRIVLGFDGRIGNLAFVQKATSEIGQEQLQKQLRSLEYVIQWGTMTLQDAIDFCKLSIETTTAIQRFSDGIQANPGDMPGVGGPVDIAVITPQKGFIWVNKKNLKIGDKEIDLDNFEDLKLAKPKEKNEFRNGKIKKQV